MEALANGKLERTLGAAGTADPGDEREISLLDLAAVLARRKGFIALVTLVVMAMTAAVVLLMPPTYTAEAVVLPPQPDQSSQSLLMGPLAGLGGLGAIAGGGAASLLRNPAELYIGVLKSRTIADALIAKFHLQSLYRHKNMTSTRKDLARHTTILVGRDWLIRIRVDDHDPARSAALANAYVEELHNQNSRLALTSASQRRLFFQQHLVTEKDALADAELALKNTQQSSGLVYPPGQSEALIRSIAQLRAEIASRQVQLESVRVYGTSENPQVQLLERGIAALRDQLERLETGSQAGGGTDFAIRTLPAVSLEYLRKLRDLKYHETLFELLSKQYEAAHLDEAREAPLIQVVDSAVVPDTKSWPPRTLITLGSGCLTAIFACLFVLLRRGAVNRARADE
jgi:tyrosine-protein kinase Etk/Wzc